MLAVVVMSRRIKRRETSSFVAIPKAVINSNNYASLSGVGVKLLIQIAEQFNGFNNGDLQASWVIMRHKGWRSNATLNRAKQELIEKGFIEQTRQGWLRPPRCALYALTWKSIDDCQGKLDVQATRVASGFWKDEKS